MGVVAAAINLIADLRRDGHLTDGARMIEFGTQDVHGAVKWAIGNLCDAFGAAEFPLPEGRPTSRAVFEHVGFQYQCIDLDGRPGTLPWDLNYMQCPQEMFGAHQLVTNHGTTEHLIGQHNAFRLLHDLTAVGGIMFHTNPCTGFVDHGFYSYSPMFFAGMAKANDYEVIRIGLTDYATLTDYQYGMQMPEQSHVMAIFKKVRQAPFQVPMQVP